jgi:hypothetical protein
MCALYTCKICTCVQGVFFYKTMHSTFITKFYTFAKVGVFTALFPFCQCCGTGTGTVGTVTFCLVEPEPELEP